MMRTTKLRHPSRIISSLRWLLPSRMGTIKNSIWSKEHVIRGIEKMCKSEILCERSVKHRCQKAN